VQRHAVDGRYFVGLPIPAAAGQLATIVYFRPFALVTRGGAMVVVALLICLAFLMVSTLRYWSFKNLDLRARRSYINVLFIAMTFALIALYREFSLLTIATLYSLSAPVAYVAAMFRRRSGPPPVVATGERAS
jgi:CDP-diacylglycerol--serine O-phosphatidyltransferase